MYIQLRIMNAFFTVNLLTIDFLCLKSFTLQTFPLLEKKELLCTFIIVFMTVACVVLIF